jgi:hypothetical protein
MMTRLLLQVCAVTLLAATLTQAFSVVPTQRFGVSTVSVSSASATYYNSQPTSLSMTTSDGAEEASPEVETTEETVAEAEDDAVEGELVTEEEESADEAVEEITDTEAEPEPTAEELELVALKEEIAEMEKTLKERRVQVALTTDTADEFSAAGYARKVAEMEMMRRTKRVSTSTVRVESSVECRVYSKVQYSRVQSMETGTFLLLVLITSHSYFRILTYLHTFTFTDHAIVRQ